ncbi:DUF2242 domain-containing protein [Pseudomonas turukhanskensis]|uniref:Lipoprotein n=1 Tax=Pseudomonas turukhanskensis TaxID=1806536 RepID=A0A9W6NFD9_9PSED|nr:DUF2242 domain-containing protein [Pseudomonas turukhanskensis]GLK88903.1 lipoprotein [Pseudomonas turukhanskensis]
MFKPFPLQCAALALVLAGAAGCSSNNTAVYEHEDFADSGTFSRNYSSSDAVSCEAARRALLSQGYIITSADPKQVSGHKSFQQSGDNHLEISFNVVCTDGGTSDHHSTMFANALQDRYALKKLNNSASLGVGVLGSVSMPIGSTDDSLVKVASETVSSAKFYERFFALVELFLPPQVKPAEPVAPAAPQQDLGIPEPQALAPATAPVTQEVVTPVIEPAATPVVDPVTEPVVEPMAPELPISEPTPAPADTTPDAAALQAAPPVVEQPMTETPADVVEPAPAVDGTEEAAPAAQ